MGCDNFGSSQTSPYLQLWDPSPANGNKSSLVFNGQGSNVTALKYYNDTILISGSEDKYVRIWDLTTGTAVRSIDTLLTVNALITLSNGLFVTAGGNDIKVWYLDTGSHKSTVSHAKTVNVLEVLDDGFASGSEDFFIKLWNNTGDWTKNLNANNPVKSLKRISSDLLASGLAGNNHVLVWFLNNQTIKCDVSGHSNNVNALEMLSNGYLASGDANGWIKIWDIVSCLEVNNMNYGSPTHSGKVNALKLIDVNLMASASSDKTIRIWNTTTGTQINLLTTNLFNYALELLGIIFNKRLFSFKLFNLF